MSTIEFATYNLNPKTATRIQDAATSVAGRGIVLQELTTPDQVHAYTEPSDPLICRLLVVQGDQTDLIGSDLDADQPLSILQLFDTESDVGQVPASLSPIINQASSNANVKQIVSIFSRMAYEVAIRWEHRARHQIQLASEAMHFLVADGATDTSSFLDTARDVLKAMGITMGCFEGIGDEYTIIQQVGTPVLSVEELRTHVQGVEALHQIETRSFPIEQEHDPSPQAHQQRTAIASIFLDHQGTQIFVLYEFESTLPIQILSGICQTVSHELRLLHDYGAAKARSDLMKAFADTELLLPDTDAVFKKILELLKNYANGLRRIFLAK